MSGKRTRALLLIGLVLSLSGPLRIGGSGSLRADDSAPKPGDLEVFKKKIQVIPPLTPDGETLYVYEGQYYAGLLNLELTIQDLVHSRHSPLSKVYSDLETAEGKKLWAFGAQKFESHESLIAYLLQLHELGPDTMAFKFAPKKDKIDAKAAKVEITKFEDEIFELLSEAKSSSEQRKEEIARQVKRLEEKIGELVARIRPGDAIGFMANGRIEVLTDSNAAEILKGFDATAPAPLKNIAVKTEGLLGLCASSEQMTRVINLILDNILRNADAKQVLDVLVIVDSTSSMSEEINDVKKNGQAMVTKLEEFARAGLDIQLGVMEYNDLDGTKAPFPDGRMSRLKAPLSTNFESSRAAIGAIEVFGGGDIPEAVADALLDSDPHNPAALVKWRKEAIKRIILITDAPPQETARCSEVSMELVLKRMTRAEAVKVYPILVSR